MPPSPQTMYDLIQSWLSGSRLREAMHRTIDEGLFPEEDVHHAVNVLHETITPEILERWVKRAEEAGSSTAADDPGGVGNPTTGGARKVLCLHAGNLPLVGLQDAVAVLLSGHHYYGKISRKDPWLLPSFLDTVRESMESRDNPSSDLSPSSRAQVRDSKPAPSSRAQVRDSKPAPSSRAQVREIKPAPSSRAQVREIKPAPSSRAQVRDSKPAPSSRAQVRDSEPKSRDISFRNQLPNYSTGLESFANLHADAVLFAGSRNSVPDVRRELERIKAVHPRTRYLIRTAQFSVACITRRESAPDLLEAIARYRGRGCRSVGVVVSPISLHHFFNMPDTGMRIKTSKPEKHGAGQHYRQLAGHAIHFLMPERDQNKPAALTGYAHYIRAYAVAAGYPVVQAGQQVLVQTGDFSLAGPGVVLWVKGAPGEAEPVIVAFGDRIQTVYHDSDEPLMHKVQGRTVIGEPPGRAQSPDFDWKPDGTDTLQWLAES